MDDAGIYCTFQYISSTPLHQRIIEPGPKEALRTAAAHEHRSIANMIEVLIRDYCGRNGITIQEQEAVLLEDERKPQPAER